MAAIKIRWTPAAEADLLDILEFYYDRNGNIEYSLKLNDNIKPHIQLLKQHPFLGRRTKHKNVRALLYEYLLDTILIIMIWDCRRNPDDKVIENRI